jgi:hypothetical protein
MKTVTVKKGRERNYFGPIMIFFSSIGLGYGLVN